MRQWNTKFTIFPLLLLGALFGCNSSHPKTNPAIRYESILNGDSAFATIQTSPSLFKGVLEIRYKNGYKDSGNVKGFIKGDTLMGEYHFQKYWFSVWKRDPIIFLRKGNRLIMGKGIVKYTMGIPHYNNLYQVDYDVQTHFVFIPKSRLIFFKSL